MNNKSRYEEEWIVLDGESLSELLVEAARIIKEEKLEPQVFTARLYGYDWRLSFPGKRK